MSFVRTILGDLPTSELGRCSAHEHIIINGLFIAEKHPDFLLDDIEAACVDLREFRERRRSMGCRLHAHRLRSLRAEACHSLAEKRRTRRLSDWPAPSFLLPAESPDALNGPGEVGRPVRARGGRGYQRRCRPPTLSSRRGQSRWHFEKLTPLEREAFAAAAETSSRTGCPIITHTEQGTAGEEQIRLLLDGGADPVHVVLSHADRLPDIAYHRTLLSSGVTLEYDQHFRTYLKEGACPTVDLIARLAPEFPDQIVVGMDMARRSYWHGHGGKPGLVWLLTALPALLKERGVSDQLIERILTHNPARAFAFGPAREMSAQT